jgi:hypothetical protein
MVDECNSKKQKRIKRKSKKIRNKLGVRTKDKEELKSNY